MKRFIIEREIPGASELTESQLADISRTSNAAVASLDVPYNWITSLMRNKLKEKVSQTADITTKDFFLQKDHLDDCWDIFVVAEPAAAGSGSR